jgi:hypothetical protein
MLGCLVAVLLLLNNKLDTWFKVCYGLPHVCLSGIAKARELYEVALHYLTIWYSMVFYACFWFDRCWEEWLVGPLQSLFYNLLVTGHWTVVETIAVFYELRVSGNPVRLHNCHLSSRKDLAPHDLSSFLRYTSLLQSAFLSWSSCIETSHWQREERPCSRVN